MDTDKNNFDDIILDKTNKNEKIKKILLRVIALAILFLLVMIVMKLINSSDTKSQAMSNTIFPSEPQTPIEKPFNAVPITDSNSSDLDEFEALRKRLQGLDENLSVDENISASENTNEAQINTLPATQTKEKQQEKTNKNDTLKDKNENIIKENRKEERKKEEVKKQEEVKSPTELFSNIKTDPSKLEAGAYIQVFSVASFDPKSKELALLKQNGYEHKLYKTKINGKEITRVLVGPFSKNDINNELKNIREKIEKEAFIFQVR